MILRRENEKNMLCLLKDNNINIFKIYWNQKAKFHQI